MKRFHVHLAVADLSASTTFYTSLFGEPTKIEADYVKWMVDDPCLNFAISTRGHTPGLNHLGIQLDSEAEMTAMRTKLEKADRSLVEQVASDCCYATSDKYWITDPQGVAWETFHTLANIPTYGEDVLPATEAPAARCCVPEVASTKAVACCAAGAGS
jgi:catechol 2,3-dioxygenase-like lactoylglutathione lyase family enzyme